MLAPDGLNSWDTPMVDETLAIAARVNKRHSIALCMHTFGSVTKPMHITFLLEQSSTLSAAIPMPTPTVW